MVVETPAVYPMMNILQRATLRLFADYEVAGKENVPPMGPLIVVVNHQSNIDPPVMGASFPRHVWFMAKDGIFRGPLANWFMRSYGAFPLNRDRMDVRAYRWILRQLDQDKAVVIFPEGTRNPGALGKARSGVVQLALKTGAPLIPVGITGTERLGSWLRVFNPTGKIRVNIGTVFSLPRIEGKPSAEVLDSLTDTVMGRVAALLPESYRGEYAIRPSAEVRAVEAGATPVENARTPPT